MHSRTCPRHTDAWRRWRDDYCGTCKTIGARYGQAARFTLNHDVVFLAELLGALSPDRAAKTSAYQSFNCMKLPRKKSEMPPILRYTGAATLVLAEFKMVDHVQDSLQRRWRGFARMLTRLFSRPFRDAERDLALLGFPMEQLRATLALQPKREREGRTLCEFAAPTVEATALFFAHGAVVAGLAQAAKDTLERMGRTFGELTYLLDALEDYEKDATSGEFNAIRAERKLKISDPFDAEIRGGVTAQLSHLANSIGEQLRELPLASEVAETFILRMKSNLQSKIGLPVLQAIPCRKKSSRRERWDEALTFARGLSSKAPAWRIPLTVAAVACVAYLMPVHSRAASTPSECLSLGLNAMAIGSVFAMSDESDSRNHSADSSGGVCALMCCSKCLTGKWCCCCDDPDCCLGPSKQ